MGGCASADLSEAVPQSQQRKRQAASKSVTKRQRRVPSKSVAQEPYRKAAGEWSRGQLGWTSKHFQIMKDLAWYDYPQDEGILITQAFLSGQPMCDFTFKGKRYHYDFRKMIQVDCRTGDLRQIRPHPDLKQPVKPLLPPGPMVVATIEKGQSGTIIYKPDPNNEGQQLRIMVPKSAKRGSKVGVPCGKPGETFDNIVERQVSYPTEASSKVESMRTAGFHVLVGIVLDDYLLVKRELTVSETLNGSADMTGIESKSTQASSTSVEEDDEDEQDGSHRDEDEVEEAEEEQEAEEEEELPAAILLSTRDYDSDASDDDEDGMVTVSTGERVLVCVRRQIATS